MIDWLNDNSGAVQAASAVVLGITLMAVAYYARQTRKQAQASVQMAEEMREQRLLTMRPIVVLYPLAEENEPGTGQEKIRLALKGPLADSTPVRLTNIGPGIAIGIRVPYKLPQEDSKERIIQYLVSGSSETERHFYLNRAGNSESRRLLRIDYYDVFGNCYETTLEFHKDPDSNHFVFTGVVQKEMPK